MHINIKYKVNIKIFQFIISFIAQMFIEHLIYISYYARCSTSVIHKTHYAVESLGEHFKHRNPWDII